MARIAIASLLLVLASSTGAGASEPAKRATPQKPARGKSVAALSTGQPARPPPGARLALPAASGAREDVHFRSRAGRGLALRGCEAAREACRAGDDEACGQQGACGP